MEPVDTQGLDHIRIHGSDRWVVGMRPDDPLASREYIEKKDLIGKPLILPERMGVQSELVNWFGRDFKKKPGDCINIPAEVKHWHGAAPTEWFSHLAVEVPGEETSNEWCEPVTDDVYSKLK